MSRQNIEIPTRGSDIENPLTSEGDDFPMVEYDDEDDDDVSRIGRNSIADFTDTIAHHRNPTKEHPATLYDRFHRNRKKLIAALEYRDLHWTTKLFLTSLILPLAVLCLLRQLRMFVVLGVFNYSGVNLRPYMLFDITTERETMRNEEKYKGGPLTLSKVLYVSQRYMTYWVVIVLLIIATPFINEFTVVDIMDQYKIFNDNATLNFFAQVAISAVIGFANIIPSTPVRPDISSFVSSFTEQEYTIRDSPHTRLKDLTEILDDIKETGFVLMHSDIGSPIIISTKVPEELRELSGFRALLSTTTFDNNQILRFIQIEDDVDSFFVLRNDIGMCHRVEYDPFEWGTLTSDLRNFKIRVEISEMELNLYGGLSLVLLVGLFATTHKLPTSSILAAWAGLPVILAIIYRRRKSKLASVNFFTLDGRDRKYQPFNNICVSTDDIILRKIHNFKYFKALYKFTMQGKYLIHVLLKIVENCGYDWLECGLKMKDFKRLASMAVNTYEKDVGILTPNAKVFYTAPRRQNDTCVVFTLTDNGEVNSALMTRVQFERISKQLSEGKDTPSLENLFFL